MKNKKLKTMAEKIAKLEVEFDASDNYDRRKEIMEEMYHLANQITDINDLLLLDELIQEKIEKNFANN